MDLELCSALFGLMIIPFSFLYFPKIYYIKKLVIPIHITVVVIAIIGLIVVNKTVNVKTPNFYFLLLCPLFSLTILRVLLIIFNKNIKRNPKNPPRNIFLEDDGLGWDRLFYFVFMSLSLVTPVIILFYNFK